MFTLLRTLAGLRTIIMPQNLQYPWRRQLKCFFIAIGVIGIEAPQYYAVTGVLGSASLVEFLAQGAG